MAKQQGQPKETTGSESCKAAFGIGFHPSNDKANIDSSSQPKIFVSSILEFICRILDGIWSIGNLQEGEEAEAPARFLLFVTHEIDRTVSDNFVAFCRNIILGLGCSMSRMESSGRTWLIYTGTIRRTSFVSLSPLSFSALSVASIDRSCWVEDNRNGQLVAWQLTILVRYAWQSLSKVLADSFELSVMARAAEHPEQTSMSLSAFSHLFHINCCAALEETNFVRYEMGERIEE